MLDQATNRIELRQLSQSEIAALTPWASEAPGHRERFVSFDGDDFGERL